MAVDKYAAANALGASRREEGSTSGSNPDHTVTLSGGTMDVIAETKAHINNVSIRLHHIARALMRRGIGHDRSKLDSPEIEVFETYTPKLKGSTYGSDEYKVFLKEMQVALTHHYAVNRHHPEHHCAGILDMSLLDLMEMLCDWKAATERHADGDIMKSLEINQKRFGYSDELKRIFTNTIKEMETL
jgi:hypothetical protein